MIKKVFMSVFFVAALTVASLVFGKTATSAGSLTGTQIYGHYDVSSPEMTSVIVELNDLSIVAAKHSGMKQSNENLQIIRNNIINNIETSVTNVNVKREFGYLFSGIALDLPENQVMKLLSVPGLKAVYPNVQYTLVDDVEPLLTDTVTPSMFNTNPYIGAPEAWAMGYTGEGITVAVIDTGIDYYHPEIAHAFGEYKGYDFYDNDSDPIFEIDADGVPEYHGTHVAGTIAALSFGIAPDVRLLAYRVLGYGSGTSDMVIAGIEQAVIDGADVMNLSLGNILNDPDYATSIALDWAMAEGVVAVAANGNDGPDNWTVGSPGTSREAISVGATELPHTDYPVNFSTANNASYPSAEILGSTDENQFMALNGNTYEFVYVGLGSDAEYEGLDVTGKVAFIQRGVYTFVDKVNYAKNHGAIAAIIFNNSYTDYSNTTYYPIPAFKMGLDDGIMMYNELASGNNTVTINLGVVPMPETIADFSSRGPAMNTWMIKPDVSAPGVNIMSAYPGGQYAYLGGTSMATPHVAASAALIRQAHPDWTVEEVKASLMNTAVSLTDPFTGEPYPHNTQGAGSIRVAEAIVSDTLVLPGSYSFGKFVKNTGQQVKGQFFTIENLSATGKRYTFDVEFDGNPAGINVMISNNLNVLPGRTQQVRFNVRVNTSVLAPGYYEGTITVSDGLKQIVVPTILFVQEPDYPRVQFAGVESNGDGTYLAYGYFPGGADYAEIGFYTYDEENGAIGDYLGTPFYAYNLAPGYYIVEWDGTIDGIPLSPGTYVVYAYAEKAGVYGIYATLFTIE